MLGSQGSTKAIGESHANISAITHIFTSYRNDCSADLLQEIVQLNALKYAIEAFNKSFKIFRQKIAQRAIQKTCHYTLPINSLHKRVCGFVFNLLSLTLDYYTKYVFLSLKEYFFWCVSEFDVFKS